ncbi:hypothetical protein FHY55_12400 [Oceanicola sp. D3]|uniref:hypothetical protein n=1 Tax=Oceanicola sp. D3 TaxID=2587163 RepID=UPI001120028B|nr:hypothetical protein [Oceanicola sp. D3]QDC09995.1 hypothetical protein FHY55_12400 [Oceanicola sp. D3]
MPPAPPPRNVFLKRAAVVVVAVVLLMIVLGPFVGRTRPPSEDMAAEMLHAFDGQALAAMAPTGEIVTMQVEPGLEPYTMLCHRFERPWRGLMGTAQKTTPDAFNCVLRVAVEGGLLHRMILQAIALPESPPPEALEEAGAAWLGGFVLVPLDARALGRAFP